MGFFKKLVWHTRARDPACAWRAGSASVVGALATLVLACTPPDRPSRLPEPLPEELLSYLGADSIRALFLHDGLSYHFVWSEKGPWAVHVLRLDLGRCDLGLRVLPAGETGLHGAGLSTVTELVGKASRGVLAAVNGDFFTPEGRPLGSEVAVGGSCGLGSDRAWSGHRGAPLGSAWSCGKGAGCPRAFGCPGAGPAGPR